MSTTTYSAQPEMVTRPNVDDVEPQRLTAGTGHWRGTTVLHLQTLVDENVELTINPLWCFEPVQLTEEWSDVDIPQ